MFSRLAQSVRHQRSHRS